MNKGEVLSCPLTPEGWLKVTRQFEWKIPHALGALNREDIVIKTANSGSLYYNYKGFFGIVLTRPPI